MSRSLIFISALLECLAIGSCEADGPGSEVETSDNDIHVASDTSSETPAGPDSDTAFDTGSGEPASDSVADTLSDEPTEDSATDTGSDSQPLVPCQSAIITDIDETLTTSDSEWLKKVVMPSYDPAMRPDANTLMQGYAALGYHIFYLTARGELLSLLDGTSAREATRTWLEDHDFPFENGHLFLSSGLAALDEAAVTYKQGKIEDLMADGWSIAYAYGNALSDIAAFKGAGIPDDRIFLVGKLAGQEDVIPIPTDEAYTEHLAEFLPTVPATDCQ